MLGYHICLYTLTMTSCLIFLMALLGVIPWVILVTDFPRVFVTILKKLSVSKGTGGKDRKEYAAGYRSGPFARTAPFFNIICNPRSAAVKKRSNTIRLVINMSYPHDGSSVNEQCRKLNQSNLTLDQVAALILALGSGTYLFKFDVCAAYKQIRLVIDDWHLQGEMFFDPDGLLCFDFCSAANFGARSSGFIWERYGMALEFMFRWVALVDAVVRYVDDFMAFSAPRPGHDLCYFASMKHRVLSLANDLGVDLDKFDEGTRLIFLGVTIDTVKLRFEIPPDRLVSIISDLRGWSERVGCTKQELQCLVGCLQYLTRVFPWGRAFLHRIIRLIANNRPPHAPVRLSNGMRLDLQWWLDVLPS